MTDVWWSFTFTCNTCGEQAEVVDGIEVPHRCRIEFPDPE